MCVRFFGRFFRSESITQTKKNLVVFVTATIIDPAGNPVLLVNGSASRDERYYDEPDRFDIDREQGQNIGFGYGVHSCLGAALARMESRIALELMRERMPKFELHRDGLRRVNMTNVAGFASVPVTVWGVQPDYDRLRRYEEQGVSRGVVQLAPEKAEKVLPILDRWAELIRRLG